MMLTDLLYNDTAQTVTQEYDRSLWIVLARSEVWLLQWLRRLTLLLILNLFSKALAISITPALEVPVDTLELYPKSRILAFGNRAGRNFSS